MYSRLSCAALAALSITLATGVAAAHVSILSGPAQANRSQKLTFGVGHGCEGHDTVRVRVDIPAGITSVRALRSDFGRPTLIRDGANAVVAVEWEKPAGEVLDADDGYYELTIRARVPDAAFSRIPFVVTQTCRDTTAGTDLPPVVWDEPPGGENEAPQLVVVPTRTAGWNEITVVAPVAEADVPIYLGEAQIVWRGTAAYSSNAAVAAQIAATPGVTPLTGGLGAGDTLWVKY